MKYVIGFIFVALVLSGCASGQTWKVNCGDTEGKYRGQLQTWDTGWRFYHNDGRITDFDPNARCEATLTREAAH